MARDKNNDDTPIFSINEVKEMLERLNISWKEFDKDAVEKEISNMGKLGAKKLKEL